MIKHFCTFVNYQKDDWSEKLVMTKLAANNNISVSTKLSWFFATKSLHPRMSFELVDLFNTNICE